MQQLLYELLKKVVSKFVLDTSEGIVRPWSSIRNIQFYEARQFSTEHSILKDNVTTFDNVRLDIKHRLTSIHQQI